MIIRVTNGIKTTSLTEIVSLFRSAMTIHKQENADVVVNVTIDLGDQSYQAVKSLLMSV